MTKTIALLTDFGTKDVYVGVMKGVMRRICPTADFIDISHHVAPQSVREGALALLNSYHYFPHGTIFLVIIDPGVGSTRRPLAVRTEHYTFVAPDNGVLSYVLARQTPYEAVMLNNPRYHLANRSATFHGRDVFAPVVAHIAQSELPLNAIGEPITDLFDLPIPSLTVEPNRVVGEVVHIDHFGNIITSIGRLRWLSDTQLHLESLDKGEELAVINTDNISVHIHDDIIYSVQRAYYEVPRGELMTQVDSNGQLEVAINQGDAAQRLDVAIGDVVELRWTTDTD